VRTSRVSCLVSVILAPGTELPVESSTRPLMVPLELWATRAGEDSRHADISCSAKEFRKRRSMVETENRRLTAFLQGQQ
jgi:hypothetical protein